MYSFEIEFQPPSRSRQRVGTIFKFYKSKLMNNRFEAYDAKNPEVWLAFQKFTFQLINNGITSFGAKAIFERIRFEVTLEKGADAFKCNNNYTAKYARKFMSEYPQHNGFFTLRQPPKIRPAAGVDTTNQVTCLKQAARIMGQAAHKKTKQPAGQKNFAWGKS